MMHDRDSCAKLTSLKIYKLSHRTKAAGQSVKAKVDTLDVCYTITQRIKKHSIFHRNK